MDFLKDWLRFARFWLYITCLQGYNALKDYFPTMEMRPNPQCSNATCLERQVNLEKALVDWQLIS